MEERGIIDWTLLVSLEMDACSVFSKTDLVYTLKNMNSEYMIQFI